MIFVHSVLRRAIARVLSRLEYGTSQTNNTVLLIFQTLLQMLSVTSATQRSVATMVLAEWAWEAEVCVFQAGAAIIFTVIITVSVRELRNTNTDLKLPRL